ncbi:MAG: gliding motility-associated C-terminal domain-containing protein [Bacteroidetes bacterium]|nr:gliding motility-associated C-terminal domain-containing protein [Bacteroidota bacterium]
MNLRKLLPIIFTCAFISAHAQMPVIHFTENKNQWQSSVLYRTQLYGGFMYAEKNCLTYFFYDTHNAHKHFTDSTDLIKISPEEKAEFLKTGMPLNLRLLKSQHSHNACSHADDDEPQPKKTHAYKVYFEGMNNRTHVSAHERLPGVEHFFLGNDSKKWASNVVSYKKIKYHEIYRYTDLYLYDAGGTMKYDFVVRPGGNPGKIKLRYDGVNRMAIDQKGNLIITTSVNEVIEQKPYAYQIIGNDTVAVECSYNLHRFELTYRVGDYNPEHTLYIDPELIFSTYTGSTSDNWGFTATYDLENNVYSGGIVEGFGYPVSIGASQTTYGGGSWDVGIIKYDPTGTRRLYASYIGGASAEMPHSLIVNSKNELLILGTTGSVDFPVRNAIQPTFAGGTSIIYGHVINFESGLDIFVTRLSADGSQLLSSTYMGGSENDGLNFDRGLVSYQYYGRDSLYYNHSDGARGEIMLDTLDNIYIASTTFSTDFPVKNAFQPVSGGSQDGVIFKLNADMTNLEWSSYIGGESKDAAYSITIDKEGNVFATGGTCSQTMNVPFNGFIPNRIGGTVDAFLIKLDQSGNLLAGTYFGSDRHDQAHFVRCNSLGNVFLFGQTTATGSTLIYNAKFQQPNSGQFLASFSNDLSTLNWSTVFGSGNGTPNITPTAFEVDICNRIYLAGYGREWETDYSIGTYYNEYWKEWMYDNGWYFMQGTKNMFITPDAYQKHTDGKDFYLMVIDDEANEVGYATYFGEIHNYNTCRGSGREHVDGGTARFDKKGNIYQSVCASCGGCNGFPTYPKPGAWSNNNNSRNCNNAVFRFYIGFGLLVADFELPEITCSANELTFIDKSQHLYNNPQLEYEWYVDDSSILSTDEHFTHIFPEPGEYEIKLIVRDVSSCNLVDSISKKLIITEQIAYDVLPAKYICAGETIEIGIPNEYNPNYTYTWKPSEGLSTPDRPQTNATPGETTDYELTVASNWCKTIYTQTVNVFKNDYHILELKVTQNGEERNPVCSGDWYTVTAYTSAPTRRYIWSTSPTFNPVINPDFSQSSITFMPTGKVTYYVRTFSEYCNFQTEAMVEVNVSFNDVKAFGETFICKGDVVEIGVENLYPANSMTYSWSPQHFIVSGVQSATPLVKPGVSTNFVVHARNQDGCVKIDTVHVAVNDLEMLTVVNTPISCFGETDAALEVSHVGGTAPYTYLWNDGSSNPAKQNLGEGVYSITITDGLDCVVTETFEIIEPQPLELKNIAAANVNCENACNGSIQLTIEGGTKPYSVQWSNEQNTQDLYNLCPGIYTAEITDAHNCAAITTQEITITVENKLPLLDATADKYIVYKGQKVQLSALPTPQEGVSYMWTPMIWIENAYSAHATVTPPHSYTYVVHATDSYGCTNTDTVHLQVVDWDCTKEFIFVPTAFTPNNDGVNDIFEIKSGAITELEFAIFDRWGEKIFETTDLHAQWDGKYKGKPLEPQVLVYYIYARCLDNREFRDKGNITIIK